MKTISSFLVAMALLLGAGSSTFAKAKGNKVTLSDFKGSYTGMVTLTAQGVSYTGPVSLVFSAVKSGKSGSVFLNGSISGNGTTAPVTATILLSNGALSTDNFVYISGPYPGTGSYTRTNRAINFQGSATVANTTYPFSGSFQTSTKGHKQKLIFTDVISVGSGMFYTFTFDVSRHVKGGRK